MSRQSIVSRVQQKDTHQNIWSTCSRNRLQSIIHSDHYGFVGICHAICCPCCTVIILCEYLAILARELMSPTTTTLSSNVWKRMAEVQALIYEVKEREEKDSSKHWRIIAGPSNLLPFHQAFPLITDSFLNSAQINWEKVYHLINWARVARGGGGGEMAQWKTASPQLFSISSPQKAFCVALLLSHYWQ